MSVIEVRQIVVDVDKGATLGEALRDAAILALKEDRDVLFNFNGEPYRTSPKDIINFLEGRLPR